jgi:hypothetical protein
MKHCTSATASNQAMCINTSPSSFASFILSTHILSAGGGQKSKQRLHIVPYRLEGREIAIRVGESRKHGHYLDYYLFHVGNVYTRYGISRPLWNWIRPSVPE